MTVTFDTVDEIWAPEGLLKIIRNGNAYKWNVYGKNNYDQPLFTGESGDFFACQKEGELRLFKDLRQIFWILNEASQKERKEGEPKDADTIEQAIRALNMGDKNKAVRALDAIIGQERAEGEPEDVQRLQMARTLVLAEKSVKKFPSEPAQAGQVVDTNQEKEVDEETDMLTY